MEKKLKHKIIHTLCWWNSVVGTATYSWPVWCVAIFPSCVCVCVCTYKSAYARAHALVYKLSEFYGSNYNLTIIEAASRQNATVWKWHGIISCKLLLNAVEIINYYLRILFLIFSVHAAEMGRLVRIDLWTWKIFFFFFFSHTCWFVCSLARILNYVSGI